MVKNRIEREEIERWLKKLEDKLNKARLMDERRKDFLENIRAYVRDCRYWMDKGDYVKAWEVVSFAWGLFEAGEELEVLKLER
jgi:hypothetical protein